MGITGIAEAENIDTDEQQDDINNTGVTDDEPQDRNEYEGQ